MVGATQELGKNLLVDFICQANLGRSDGGQETWAYQFIPALLHLHPEIIVRVYGQRLEGKPDTRRDLETAAGDAKSRLQTHFFQARRTPWPLLFSMMRQFVGRKRREERPTADISIAVGSVVELLTILLSPAARRSFKVVWLRTIFIDQKASRIPRPLRRLARWFDARLLARADLLIANGDDIAAYYGARNIEVAIIKNAVDLAAWEMKPVALVRPIQIAYVGRLALEKGIPEFLQVARLIKGSADSEEFTFHVIGALGEEKLARQSEDAEEIVWHGTVSRDQLPTVLSRMDVCVAFTFASAEGGGGGTSNAMMEQLAAGRVLLAWDNVIFRQWLSQENAYLVPQGDVDAVVAALRAIAADRDRARRRAAAGRAAVEPFTIPAMMAKFEDLLRNCWRGRPDMKV